MIYMIDIVLGIAALAAGAYCLILSRRLRALARIDGSVGGAVAVLSAQVDALSRTLQSSQSVAKGAESRLEQQTARAEVAVRKLELLMASLQDLPQPGLEGQAAQPTSVPAWASVPSAVAPRPRAPGHDVHVPWAQDDDSAYHDGDLSRPRARITRRRRAFEETS